MLVCTAHRAATDRLTVSDGRSLFSSLANCRVTTDSTKIPLLTSKEIRAKYRCLGILCGKLFFQSGEE